MNRYIQSLLLVAGLFGMSTLTFVACAGECEPVPISNKRVYSVLTSTGEQVTEFSLIITFPKPEDDYHDFDDAILEVVVACPTTDPLVECRFDHPAAPGLWTLLLPTGFGEGSNYNILIEGKGPWGGQLFDGTFDSHEARLVNGESLGEACGRTQRQNYSVYEFTLTDAADQ